VSAESSSESSPSRELLLASLHDTSLLSNMLMSMRTWSPSARQEQGTERRPTSTHFSSAKLTASAVLKPQLKPLW